MSSTDPASAGGEDSAWAPRPGSGEWDAPTNWVPAVVPTDTASFGESSRAEIVFGPSAGATVGRIVFGEAAPSYALRFAAPAPDRPALTISGEGVLNHSGRGQHFIVASTAAGYRNPQLRFANRSKAGERDTHYYAGPETLEGGYGGGVIGFCDASKAGSASFVVRTGAVAPPREDSTVGGEVSFSDSATADGASFTIYGSLGTDGDTFGNTVFHDESTADHATFTNVGGTVAGGDGGNTQFYDSSTAAFGIFNNQGGTHPDANGGDVAFDGTADGGHGRFHNYAATVAGGNGGVTSFNNNPPEVTSGGASAGHGFYHNYGALERGQGGGGHTEFTAKHGSPTAGKGTFGNYGSAIAGSSSAGHTIFSVSLPSEYHPTAGTGTFWNHPAVVGDGAAGYVEFAIWAGEDEAGTRAGASHGTPSAGSSGGRAAPGAGAGTGVPTAGDGTGVPTAGDGTFHNLGGQTPGAAGGYTVFKNTSSAGNARLIAYGGTGGGEGGRIVFYDDASGGTASVHLYGDGALDIGDHTGGLTIGRLELNGGVVETRIGTDTTCLTLADGLAPHSAVTTFSFRKEDGGGFAPDTAYTILSAPNLSSFEPARFAGNRLDGLKPTFRILGQSLEVSFHS